MWREEAEDAEIVKEEALLIFGKFFGEFKELNTEISPLLEDDDKQEDQCHWYLPKCLEFEDFVQKTESWIEMVLRGCKEDDCGDVDYGPHDDIQPSDSISEVISRTPRRNKATYVFSYPSQMSSKSSAHLKLEAEHEELLIRAAFLKKRQDIEVEEACLKARKEQLDLEAKISASDAKIKIYADYEGGQDGMNECYESKVKPTASLKGTYQVKKEDDEEQRVRFPAPVGTQPPARTSTVDHRALPHRVTG